MRERERERERDRERERERQRERERDRQNDYHKEPPGMICKLSSLNCASRRVFVNCDFWGVSV